MAKISYADCLWFISSHFSASHSWNVSRSPKLQKFSIWGV